jgi:EmrB/QacA subfamily drug resistance transporter
MSVAALMVALDQLVVATALNTIRDDLHASIATLEWTVNAYSLSFAVLLITGAALGDRFGRRRLLVVGLLVFTLASAACALAPNTGLLIAARAVQGAGSALVMPLAVALLTTAFPPQKRGGALGIFTALTGLAVVGGPLVGGAITAGIAWQWIFWINVPIGAVLIPLVLVRTPESRGPRARPDLFGLGLVSAGMFGIVWGLVRANTAGWGSGEVAGMLVAGTVATIAFLAWEARASEPMLPVKLFADRTFSAASIAAFLLTAALFSTVFFFAQYLQISLGYRPLAAGFRFLPWTLALFVIAPAAGRLSDRIGNRTLLGAGLILQAVGVFNTARQLGGAFGVSILSAVFAANGSYAGPGAFRDGVGPAIAVAAGLSLFGAIAAMFVRRGPAGSAAVVTTRPVKVDVVAE